MTAGATAALLIRAATIDDTMSDARRDKLRAVLKSHFSLNDTATAELIEKGLKTGKRSISTISPAGSALRWTMKVAAALSR